LSGDFDVFFTVGEGLEDTSELVLSGNADHSEVRLVEGM
jgi:hypothetical protein